MTNRRLARRQVLAYRVTAQQLDRSGSTCDELAVLDVGVQDATGSARLALDARLPAVTDVPADPTAAGTLSLVWSVRAAPHLHRRAELDAVRRWNRPLSSDDVFFRLGDAGRRIRAAGIEGIRAFDTAAREMGPLLRHAIPKGEASHGLTEHLAEPYSRYCRGCDAVHVSDLVLRPAALMAGAELDWGTSPPVLRRTGRVRRAREGEVAAIVDAYLRLLGPATPGDVAGYLGARAADVRARWPDDLVEVDVEGRRAWARPGDLDALGNATMPEHVRLLGAFDPYLQARDRDLIVADRATQKVLWPVLGRPGAVLADGEVVATWRPKSSGRRLELTVSEFTPVHAAIGDAVQAEAERMATLRGAPDVRVRWK